MGHSAAWWHRYGATPGVYRGAAPAAGGRSMAGPPLAGRRLAGQSAHAAAGAVTAPARAGMVPAAIRASQACRRVTTAHSQRSSAAAHAARACPSLSRLPLSRPVRCAYRAASTGLFRKRGPHRPPSRQPELGAAAFTTVALGVLSYRNGQALFWDKDQRKPAPADASWAARWEKRSRDRGKASQVMGWKADPLEGSTLVPPGYQKLEGDWVNGQDPAKTV